VGWSEAPMLFEWGLGPWDLEHLLAMGLGPQGPLAQWGMGPGAWGPKGHKISLD